MAHMTQEKKAIISNLMKPILKKYNVKATLSVDNHSTINLNIKSSAYDFVGIYNKKNKEDHAWRFPNETFYPREHLELSAGWVGDSFEGEELAFFQEAFEALQGAGYYNNSDSQSDYFDHAYYFGISVGKWDKPYVHIVK